MLENIGHLQVEVLLMQIGQGVSHIEDQHLDIIYLLEEIW